MLNYIKIKNYHSHKDTLIEFKDGLNIITGASDSGKSVIFRAFGWVLNNRPLGDDIKNWDAKKDDIVSVEISIDDILVSKERKKNKNIYYIVVNDEKQIFEAVGQDVPEQIISALGMTDINLQAQHDKYFLLDSGISAGEVAKKFNKTVGLDIIDKTYRNFASNISQNKADLERIENEIKNKKQDLDRLSFVDHFMPLFLELKSDLNAVEQDKNTIKKVELILQQNQVIFTEQKQTAALLNYEKTVDYLVDSQKQIEQLRNEYRQINQLLINGKHIVCEISHSNILFGFTDRIETLFQKIEAIEEEKKIINSVSDKIYSLSNINNMAEEVQNNLSNNILLFKKELKKVNFCPFCGGTLTKEKIEHVMDSDLF